MKIIEFKSGKKEEIVDYVRAKSSGKIKSLPISYELYKDNPDKFYELESESIEQQIDSCIENGNSIATIRLINGRNHYREQFFVTNYADVYMDLEIKKLDNVKLRKERIEAIKLLMAMEGDAEELWNRIIQVMNEFKGKTLTL